MMPEPIREVKNDFRRALNTQAYWDRTSNTLGSGMVAQVYMGRYWATCPT